jgi:hypothetical protein
MGPILAGRDLVLQSATGSGKTEAVLAPCMERVIRSGRLDAVLYIVPTRALAVDLERRLAPVLVDRLGLQLGIRTGDLKRAGGGRPDLILTTPESLDVMMGSSNAEMQRFVQRVRTVVIDEVHPLLHQYRGKQLAYLLRRLERRGGGGPVQKIALSATIADVDAIIDFFGFQPADTVRLISAVQRDMAPHLVHLKGDEDLVGLLNDLHDVWNYRKILMFANSRGQCDRLFALANEKGRFRGVAELHYSNLKAKERRAIEERFRRREHTLCIATSTLELGVDIGDVDGVLLFEPPDSASAFLQRIGRSNRRQGETHFWGICRGERASEQLLRFLGLLRLARQGGVELPLPNTFPSVLIQQILSCLYEKKYISLPAMQELFPECGETLALLFPWMERLGWLRRDPSLALKAASATKAGPPTLKGEFFRGGWRYRNSFMDRKIWSNFPETEEDYILEISDLAVADLPRSIVRQLEPGDCVDLAGRRIQVLQIIDSGERKRVTARPTEDPVDKEILWLGIGAQVSFEVAQSMRAALDLPEDMEDAADLGLFARTRRLLREEKRKNSRTATLSNGIEVLRERGGFYRYRTFLGSMGNLILRFTIEKDLGAVEDLYVSSDEIGITSSHWIDFQSLSLPVDRDGFRRWIMGRLRTLRFLLPLNVFAEALPNGLLVDELTGFLYDERVVQRFSRYLSESSEIISGDVAALEVAGMEPQNRATVFLQPSAADVSMLSYEKERRGIGGGPEAFRLPADARHIPRTLTGTMIGEYMRQRQCERWLSYQFLPPDQQPRGQTGMDADLQAERTERGRLHEERVLAYLRKTGASIVSVSETDDRGARRPLKSRFNETLERLEDLIRGLNPGKPSYLSQAVFMIPSLLKWSFHREIFGLAVQQALSEAQDVSILDRIDGVGIPDLIRVFMSDGIVFLQVGDIKDSPVPYYSQKWQTAFYALLLKESIRLQLLPVGVEVSDTGFLLLRGDPADAGSGPALHLFDLEPFLSAFPALFQNIGEVLLQGPAGANCHLQGCSTTCPYFEACYREALEVEDIQFFPRLTRGELLKMRQLGLASMEEAGKWFDDKETP